MAFLMHQYFEKGEGQSTLMEFQDLLAVALKGDKLSHFLANWDWTLGGMKFLPCDKILEDLLRRQLQISIKFAPHLLMYENDIINGRAQRDYQHCLAK